MNTTQDTINDACIKAFWNHHKSRLKYKEEIEKLIPFINQVKVVAKRNMDSKFKNEKTELDLEQLINKIMISYITEKIKPIDPQTLIRP